MPAARPRERRALARDTGQRSDEPGIARATGAAALARIPEAALASGGEAAVGDADPLVRATAVAALEALPPAERPARAVAALSDPVRRSGSPPPTRWRTLRENRFPRSSAATSIGPSPS